MTDLAKGTKFTTRDTKKVIVGKKLGEGRQGAVYTVSCNGKPKALKWYFGGRLKNPRKFSENICNNIQKGPPNGSFLWPLDIIERQEGNVTDKESFGYIMELKPPEYKDFSLFLLAREHFVSVTSLVNTALRITAAFRELHNKGYSYQDLNDGNFFVNPKTGEVLICDNDNVAEYGYNLGIAGKCRYIAPEVVLGQALPGIHTDKFSLAVVLFLLLFNNHPLEGKKAFPPCMTEDLEKNIYGKEPVFIFDFEDRSNEPVPGLNNNAIKRWPLFPKYVRDKFTEAFSQKALHDPAARIIEKDWIKIFTRLRSEIFKCGCTEIFFADSKETTRCPACGNDHRFEMRLEIGKHSLAIHQRTKLYACHTEEDSDDFETITGEVIQIDASGIYELKNRSKKTWLIINSNGKQISKGPGKTVLLESGMSVVFGGVTARIMDNFSGEGYNKGGGQYGF